MEIKEDKPICLRLLHIVSTKMKLEYKFLNNEIMKSITIIVTIDDLNDLFLNIYYYQYVTGRNLTISCI